MEAFHLIELQPPFAESTRPVKRTPQELASMVDAPAGHKLWDDESVHFAVRGIGSILLSSPQVPSILMSCLERLDFCEGMARILVDLGKNLAAEEEQGPLADLAAISQSEHGLKKTIDEISWRTVDFALEASSRDLLSGLEHAFNERAPPSRGQIERGRGAVVPNSSVKSEARLTFEWDLLQYAQSPYEHRLRSIMAGATLVDQSGADLSPSKALSTIREISWVSLPLFRVFRKTRSSISDKVKTFVESQMGETWNWWPLAPASCRLRAGYYRLQWKSVCASAELCFWCPC